MLSNSDILKIKEKIDQYAQDEQDRDKRLNQVCLFINSNYLCNWHALAWILSRAINMPENVDVAILGLTTHDAWKWCKDKIIFALQSLNIEHKLDNCNKNIIFSDNRRIIFSSYVHLESLCGLKFAACMVLDNKADNWDELKNKLQPFAECGKIATGGKNEN